MYHQHLTLLRTIGDRALPVVTSKTWNSHPSEVTSSRTLQAFKSNLKTHLLSDYCKVTEVLSFAHLKMYAVIDTITIH